jgi:hypothetical protein
MSIFGMEWTGMGYVYDGVLNADKYRYNQIHRYLNSAESISPPRSPWKKLY